MQKFSKLLILFLTVSLTACTQPVSTTTPGVVEGRETAGSPAAEITQSVPVPGGLQVHIYYPQPGTSFEMGKQIKFIFDVTRGDGNKIGDASVTITIRPPGSSETYEIKALPGTDEVFRSEEFTIPHRSNTGIWSAEIQAVVQSDTGVASTTFTVDPSISEILLGKYGFWLDAPTLRGITPTLVAERGDARNGMIRWGGQIPSQHVLPTNFIELAWREGSFPLNNPDEVRSFLLNEIGDIGFTHIREIGNAVPFTFKEWQGWKVNIRGELDVDKLEWVVFYAPETEKTYALGTTVVQPPGGIDPHFTLRKSFELHPEVNPTGTAPEHLEKLLPGPVLVSPPLGQRFIGTSEPVVLQWKPVKSLEDKEYYEVSVTYDYKETRTTVVYTTMQTSIELPTKLYTTPNCAVFNWEVQLKSQTGIDPLGRLVGDPVSFPSLYWYIEWVYPPGEEMPFHYACPNQQT